MELATSHRGVGCRVALGGVLLVAAVSAWSVSADDVVGSALGLVLGTAGVACAIVGLVAAERRHARMADALDDLRTANRRLDEGRIRKDEFLASVSHELRTPLNVVLGYVDVLLDESFGRLEPAQRDILHRITKNASNLSRLVNDLLDLSRIEAQRLRIEMDVVDLESMFADLGAVMDVLLAGRDVAFEADIAPGCARVHADPDRLKQIVSNLLVNAVKFTERGTIALAASLAGDGRVAIAVSDTGIGIPEADRRAIFEPFRQGHDRSRHAPGAGIGLAISSRLAALMQGSLDVESTTGVGSRFTVTMRSATNEHAAPQLREVS